MKRHARVTLEPMMKAPRRDSLAFWWVMAAGTGSAFVLVLAYLIASIVRYGAVVRATLS